MVWPVPGLVKRWPSAGVTAARQCQIPLLSRFFRRRAEESRRRGTVAATRRRAATATRRRATLAVRPAAAVQSRAMRVLLQRVERGHGDRRRSRGGGRGPRLSRAGRRDPRRLSRERRAAWPPRSLKLRVFDDERGLMNRALGESGGAAARRLAVHPLRRHAPRQPAELHRRRAAGAGRGALRGLRGGAARRRRDGRDRRVRRPHARRARQRRAGDDPARRPERRRSGCAGPGAPVRVRRRTQGATAGGAGAACGPRPALVYTAPGFRPRAALPRRAARPAPRPAARAARRASGVRPARPRP